MEITERNTRTVNYLKKSQSSKEYNSFVKEGLYIYSKIKMIRSK